MANPGPSPNVTPGDVLEVISARDDSGPFTTVEVANHLECSRTAALEGLNDLADRGEITSRTVSEGSRVWWVPTPEDERDVLSGYGSWTGIGLSAVVERCRGTGATGLCEDGRTDS